MFMEKAKIGEHVKKEIIAPTDPTGLVAHVQKEAKERRIVLDLVKVHLIPHIVEKKINELVHEALVRLYQSSNASR
jgi:hypothetical protein